MISSKGLGQADDTQLRCSICVLRLVSLTCRRFSWKINDPNDAKRLLERMRNLCLPVLLLSWL